MYDKFKIILLVGVRLKKRHIKDIIIRGVSQLKNKIATKMSVRVKRRLVVALFLSAEHVRHGSLFLYISETKIIFNINTTTTTK